VNVAVKLGLFAAGLAVVFLAALAVGALVRPTNDAPATQHDRHPTTSTVSSP
jgi:hypothetical protein